MRLATKAAAPTTVCALGVLTACSAPSPTVSTAPAGNSAAAPSELAYAAAVQEKITAAMTANVIPGAVLRISLPTQGEWTGTFGTGDGSPLPSGAHTAPTGHVADLRGDVAEQ
jgi:D-alanyl-D-alanine carboxypeptidase